MVFAGQKVRASDIKTVQSISKAATESVTSSTTLQDDDDIAMALEVGKSYRVLLFMTVSSASTTGDIKVAWAFTGTATKASRSCLGPQGATTDASNTAVRITATALTSSVQYGHDAALSVFVLEEVHLEDLTVAGTLTLQWAQQTSSVTATVLSTSTRVYWEEIDVN